MSHGAHLIDLIGKNLSKALFTCRLPATFLKIAMNLQKHLGSTIFLKSNVCYTSFTTQ